MTVVSAAAGSETAKSTIADTADAATAARQPPERCVMSPIASRSFPCPGRVKARQAPLPPDAESVAADWQIRPMLELVQAISARARPPGGDHFQ